MAIGKALLHHKWNECSMMVVDMNNVGVMLPFTQPFGNGYLKGNEAFCIIIISIDLFPIEHALNIHAIQIKSKFIGFFFDDSEIKIISGHGKISFMHYFPFVVIKKFCAMHGHYNFGKMPELLLVLWQSSYNICEAPSFCHWIALCTYM